MGVTHSFAKYTTKIWRGREEEKAGGRKEQQAHWNAPKHMKSYEQKQVQQKRVWMPTGWWVGGCIPKKNSSQMI